MSQSADIRRTDDVSKFRAHSLERDFEDIRKCVGNFLWLINGQGFIGLLPLQLFLAAEQLDLFDVLVQQLGRFAQRLDVHPGLRRAEHDGVKCLAVFAPREAHILIASALMVMNGGLASPANKGVSVSEKITSDKIDFLIFMIGKIFIYSLMIWSF